MKLRWFHWAAIAAVVVWAARPAAKPKSPVVGVVTEGDGFTVNGE